MADTERRKWTRNQVFLIRFILHCPQELLSFISSQYLGGGKVSLQPSVLEIESAVLKQHGAGTPTACPIEQRDAPVVRGFMLRLLFNRSWRVSN